MQAGLKEEARKRQGRRTDLIENTGISTSRPIGPEVAESSTNTAARLMGVGETSIRRAARMKRDAPDLFEAMHFLFRIPVVLCGNDGRRGSNPQTAV